MLKKLYKKSEIWFAVAWIFAYVILVSAGDKISADIGISKIVTLPVLVVLCVVLFLFVKRNGVIKKYGLCKPTICSSEMLFYFPLIVLLTVNLWFGFSLNKSPAEILLYVLSMLCVGFLEEMIFRGFLFNALAENGVKSAIVVSGITFGLGHIVNLVNGSGTELLSNILQIIYATAVGFAFVMIYYKTKSLVPCIVTHSIFNGLGIFSEDSVISPEKQLISGLLIAIIAGGYALYIAIFVKEKCVK